MSKKASNLKIPDIPKLIQPPPPPKSNNPFDKLEENGEIRVHKTGRNQPILYEYSVVKLELGWNLDEIVKILGDILRKKSAEGWRYKNSIRKNASEEVLIFERGIYE